MNICEGEAHWRQRASTTKAPSPSSSTASSTSRHCVPKLGYIKQDKGYDGSGPNFILSVFGSLIQGSVFKLRFKPRRAVQTGYASTRPPCLLPPPSPSTPPSTAHVVAHDSTTSLLPPKVKFYKARSKAMDKTLDEVRCFTPHYQTSTLTNIGDSYR